MSMRRLFLHLLHVGVGEEAGHGVGYREFDLDRGCPLSGLSQELGDDSIANDRVVQELVKLGWDDGLEAEGDIAEPSGVPALAVWAAVCACIGVPVVSRRAYSK